LIKGTASIIPLHRPVLLIGRNLECDARIDQPKISRRHCCVAIAYDRVVVRDLGSRNQVRVNGQVVEEARLQPGDELAIGPILYRLELQDDPLIASPSARVARSGPATPDPRGNSLPSAAPAGVDSEHDLVPLDDA
jgi:pSer/pThr/pTyr-binding forkhead associated (FHA) protein